MKPTLYWDRKTEKLYTKTEGTSVKHRVTNNYASWVKLHPVDGKGMVQSFSPDYFKKLMARNEIMEVNEHEGLILKIKALELKRLKTAF